MNVAEKEMPDVIKAGPNHISKEDVIGAFNYAKKVLADEEKQKPENPVGKQLYAHAVWIAMEYLYAKQETVVSPKPVGAFHPIEASFQQRQKD